jgi:CheY-specific phosphatase CheX
MNRLQTHLFNVSVRVFEDLGFLLPSPILDEEQSHANLDAGVSVNFSGPANGTLCIAVSRDVLSALAANMLGQDTPPEEALQQDALREVANVICGNLLPHIGGLDAVFDIGTPQVGDPREIRTAIHGLPTIAQAIGLENGRAEIQLYLPE